MGITTPRRASGKHGVLPLSRVTRLRLLADLLRRAEDGDAAAAAALIRLSLDTDRGASATTSAPPSQAGAAP
jgi:hypothetical protein